MNQGPEISTASATPLWPPRSTSLWCGDQLIGFVAIESLELGTTTGILTPDPAFQANRPLFENAVAAERAISSANSHQYQAAWQAWKLACHELQQLDLSFGEMHVPIEGFTIDADWRVEFESALWWDALVSSSPPAAKSSTRWR